jgi:hypothetical protein
MFAIVPANTEGTGSAKAERAMHAAAHIIKTNFQADGDFTNEILSFHATTHALVAAV